MGANIKNNHVSALGVGSVSIAPGATAYVANWDKVQHAHAVKVWIAAGLLTIKAEDVTEGATPIPGGKSSSVAPSMPSMPGMDPEAVEKQKIIDELESKHGITKTLRSSLANLQKALDEANAG